MYTLYANYYAGTSRTLFVHDLLRKDHVILLEEGSHVQGFTTLKNIETEFKGQRLRVLFSGDTIVEQKHWGKNDLAQEWLKLAGQIKRQKETPLYWFLIAKGHRTYRYLNVFSRNYYPAPEIETPQWEQGLMDHLALNLFGKDYDPAAGVLCFPESKGHLHPIWAEIPPKDLLKKEVRFFLQRNPGYRKGDELVCLCELSEGNLKPLSRRLFGHG